MPKHLVQQCCIVAQHLADGNGRAQGPPAKLPLVRGAHQGLGGSAGGGARWIRHGRPSLPRLFTGRLAPYEFVNKYNNGTSAATVPVQPGTTASWGHGARCSLVPVPAEATEAIEAMRPVPAEAIEAGAPEEELGEATNSKRSEKKKQSEKKK